MTSYRSERGRLCARGRTEVAPDARGLRLAV